jgi:hypothetical protein
MNDVETGKKEKDDVTIMHPEGTVTTRPNVCPSSVPALTKMGEKFCGFLPSAVAPL